MTRITVEIPEESKAELFSYLESKGIYFEEEESISELLTDEEKKHILEIDAAITGGKIELIDWEIVKKKYFND
jgi:hypothetical protein